MTIRISIAKTNQNGFPTNLFLGLMGFEGEVSKQVNKLGSFTSICRQLWPNGPGQFQQ